ncbi:MAG TPA: CaiB/BaiF CoA-transferase family protein [Dehalococcoidia bacterium]|nr:CaiB/BaiF CoA-transferase family protein [Dehalococcoidia bacterium]
MSGVLDGTRVLDLTATITGALTSLQLADAGADVIKLEPIAGDPVRQFGTASNEAGPLAQVILRGKRSVAIDLTSVASSEAVSRLLADADIVLEDYSLRGEEIPGTIRHDTARTYASGVIGCSLTAFGDEGPYSDYLATELELQGMTAHMWFLGQQGEPPVRCGADIAEFAGAQHAFLGIVSALWHREESGLGQRVSVALCEALLSLGSHWMADFSDPDEYTGGLTHPFEIPETGYRTKDKQVMFGFFGRRPQKTEPWQELCKALGLEDLLKDPWLAEHGAGLVGVGQDAQETKPLLEQAMVNWTSDDFVQLITDIGGRAAPFLSYDELYGDQLHPEVAASCALVEIQGGASAIVPAWAHDAEIGRQEHSMAPDIGQHTAEVLHAIGLSDFEIKQLEAQGAILLPA